MTANWWQHLLWICGAGVLGYASAALFAGRLRLPRRVFLVPHVALTAALLVGYARWSQMDFATLFVANWPWGVVGGALVGAMMIANVRSQPASRRSSGGALVLDISWLGVAYGLLDALFLNVMPVLAVWEGMIADGAPVGWSGRITGGLLALTASLAVTWAYHVGYPEFRNRRVALVLLGNGVITLAYLVSGSPLGAIVAHVVMHVAAVLRGPDTTMQLPPHEAALPAGALPRLGRQGARG